jgi:hypothetical protein
LIVGRLLEKDDYGWGFNAATGEYQDLVAAGVIDPARVVRTALQDAASVASLLITTEALVAEAPKPADTMPGITAGAGFQLREAGGACDCNRTSISRSMRNLPYFALGLLGPLVLALLLIVSSANALQAWHNARQHLSSPIAVKNRIAIRTPAFDWLRRP